MSKFKVDFGRLKDEFKNEEAANSSGGIIFKQKQIAENDSVDIRILPPLPSLDGKYYLKVITVWINNHPYISPRTFGLDCPIMDMYDEIMASDDTGLKSIVSNDAILNISNVYHCPILLMDLVDGKNVVVGMPRIFEYSWMTYKAMNTIISNRRYQRTELGIFDFEKGFNLIISKAVANSRTSYTALPDSESSSIDEAYGNKIPDVFAYNYKRMYGDKYLNLIMENLLYGNPMPSDDLKFEGKVLLDDAEEPTEQEQPVVKQDPIENKVPVVEKEHVKVEEPVIAKEPVTEKKADTAGMSLLDKLKAKKAAKLAAQNDE